MRSTVYMHFAANDILLIYLFIYFNLMAIKWWTWRWLKKAIRMICKRVAASPHKNNKSPAVLTIVLCEKGQIVSLSCLTKIWIWKRTCWWNNKTVILLGYRKISWFISLRLRQIIDLRLATDKLRYFTQPHPIIVDYWRIFFYCYMYYKKHFLSQLSSAFASVHFFCFVFSRPVDDCFSQERHFRTTYWNWCPY